MIILVGPSASGKTEIVKYLIKYFSYTKFVTTTTRNIRVNEINGVDYNFISTAEFLDKIKNNEFILARKAQMIPTRPPRAPSKVT